MRMTHAALTGAAVRPPAHRDGDAVHAGRLARPRRRRAAGRLPGRRAAQRRAGDQRHHRRVADHHRRGEGDRCCGRWSRRSATGPRSWPASAPTTPAHTIELARPAEKAGAHGLLRRHAVLQQAAAGRPARATSPPSPTPPACRCCSTTSRTAPASPIETETLVRLAEHERIVGGQGRQGRPDRDRPGCSRRTDLAYYSRRRRAHPAAARRSAAVGVVGTSTHLTGARTKEMIEAYERGRRRRARCALHRQLLPLFTGIFRTQGTILVKAALNCAGPARPARSARRWSTRPRPSWPSCAPTAPTRAWRLT